MHSHSALHAHTAYILGLQIPRTRLAIWPLLDPAARGTIHPKSFSNLSLAGLKRDSCRYRPTQPLDWAFYLRVVLVSSSFVRSILLHKEISIHLIVDELIYCEDKEVGVTQSDTATPSSIVAPSGPSNRTTFSADQSFPRLVSFLFP